MSTSMVTGVVSFYLVAALAMVMANKWVLNVTDAPLFFLTTQLVVAVVLFLVSDALRLLPERLSFDYRVCKGLAPMVALNVLGLSLSNYTLKYVDASFYQVARGLVLPFTVAVSGLVLHTRPSTPILLSCALVTLGFFCGVLLDAAPLSPLGIFFGVASSTITATHSVVIKQSLAVVNNSTVLLSWYTNLLSIFLLVPLIALNELPAVLLLLFPPSSSSSSPLPPGTHGSTSPRTAIAYGSLLTGLLGFLMSLASLLSIKVTSPITHMVSSAVRGVAASLLGVWLFRDVVTTGRASSIAIILAGSFCYTWVKHREAEAHKGEHGHGERGVKMADLEAGGQKPAPE